MLTDRAKELRKQFEKSKTIIEEEIASIALIDELVANCKPTRIEFNSIATEVVLHGGTFWNLLMNARENWTK